MRLRLRIQFLAISFVLLQNIIPASKLADDIKTISEDIKITVPYSDERFQEIIENFSSLENNKTCLSNEKCILAWIKAFDILTGKVNQKDFVLEVEYNFETNMTNKTEEDLAKFSLIKNNFYKKYNGAIKKLRKMNLPLRIYDRIIYFASQNTFFKDSNDAAKLTNIENSLNSIYASAKVCESKSVTECLSLEPEITELIANSRDYNRLLNIWKGWHDVTGNNMKILYKEAVALNNKKAKENGFKDLSVLWLEDFEDAKFEKKLDKLFNEIKPLYQQLHAYVRRKLKNVYGKNYPSTHNQSLIPAHLLGNMWGQSWENIYDLVVPYPNVKSLNLTKILIEKKYTPLKMFQEAEKFFVSIGLFNMTPTFWKYSMIEKPTDRQVQCHASAYDFFNNFDFRIKMCSIVNEDNFYTVHHEMGHTIYFMSYSNLANYLKNGANSGFHEAIGDTVALSVMTRKHLKKINLLDNDQMTYEQEINYLMDVALKKIAFLPFGYLMDKWRWDVFRGKIDEKNYNQKWWEMRKKFQGIESPVERTEENFDPGAKFHIANFTPYSRYFVSFILQFQFYESLCNLANQSKPLHKCDFYESKVAGSKLKDMLKLGASHHWSYALNLLTGTKSLSVNSLNEYFSPLAKWLKKENSKYSNDKIGF